MARFNAHHRNARTRGLEPQARGQDPADLDDHALAALRFADLPGPHRSPRQGSSVPEEALLAAELPIRLQWVWGSTDESMEHCMLMSAGFNWHLFDTIEIGYHPGD